MDRGCLFVCWDCPDIHVSWIVNRQQFPPINHFFFYPLFISHRLFREEHSPRSPAPALVPALWAGVDVRIPQAPLTRKNGSYQLPDQRHTRHWLNCCLTKQKLLIELMHLRVVIDLAMSLPDGERRWGVACVGGRRVVGVLCSWERQSRRKIKRQEGGGRKLESKMESRDARCTEMKPNVEAKANTRRCSRDRALLPDFHATKLIRAIVLPGIILSLLGK